MRFLRLLTLRFGGDVWWLSYVLIRDALLRHHPRAEHGLPDAQPVPRRSGSRSPRRSRPWSCSGRSCVKLIRDADDDPAAFRIVSVLLVVASVLYIVPQVYGLESADQAYLGGLPSALVSTTNLALARPILWISIGLFALTGAAMFVRFLVNLGRSESSTEAQAEETQIAA